MRSRRSPSRNLGSPMTSSGFSPRLRLGDARPSEFRTAPLMGLRFLSRFLHDGRATTVDAAVQLHGGQATDAFERLSPEDREALLTFLGSL